MATGFISCGHEWTVLVIVLARDTCGIPYSTWLVLVLTLHFPQSLAVLRIVCLNVDRMHVICLASNAQLGTGVKLIKVARTPSPSGGFHWHERAALGTLCTLLKTVGLIILFCQCQLFFGHCLYGHL